MPPRTILADNFICRSCLSNLRKRKPTAQWALRRSSQVAQPLSSTSQSRLSEEQEIEREKTLELLGLSKKQNNGVSVNYFEQGKRGQLRRLRDKDEFGRSFTELDDRTDARLKKMEKELETASQYTKIVEDIWGKSGAEKIRKRAAFQDESSNKPDLLLPEESWTVPHERNHIAHLNNMIRTVGRKGRGGAISQRLMNTSWKRYYGARMALSRMPELVHADIWDLLWQIFAADYAGNPNRMSHIHILATDMENAGLILRDDQQLLAIEATFINGFKDEAITTHKKLVTTLGAKPETSVEFWQLGLRMYCLTGDMARAERVATTLLESPYEKDVRFLMPFIRICTENPKTVEKGYELYQQLRTSLGDSITIKDYDQVISYFLATNETKYALYIFIEMMTSDSVKIRGTYKCPSSLISPFFYGKWLKRLIGTGDLQGAYNVLLYMKSKGIMPQAIVVNGLIGAWLRSDTVDNIQKAEEVAWAMINVRMQFLSIRKDMQNLATFVRLRQYGEGWPRANLETFSLLAENYKDRRKHSKMEELWAAFKGAEIPPNSFILNQLLFSYLQDGQGKQVAALSRDLRSQYQVQPDSWTFMALWQALPVNRLVKVSAGQLLQGIPEARLLFAEVVESAHILATTGIDTQLARFILHSFRKLDDKHGLLLAYRALRQIFKFTPSDAIVLELYMGSMDLGRTSKGKAGLRMIHSGKQIDDFLKRRHQELVAAGELQTGDDLPADTRKEELSNFLEAFLQSQIVENEDTEQLLAEAALVMGLRDEVPSFEPAPET
ncbi:hypothetical protein F4804DRAFT_304699 [Jackrogersella minutella]|nr:hypothetical protein F4804DRAFT_304699 [Jackrogersella minutella]